VKSIDKTKEPVILAFNLGIAAREERQFASVQAAAGYFYEFIYSNLSQKYLGIVDEGLIRANAEYLSSIALLGYILPHVCSYEEEFKDRLVELIMKKLRKPREVTEFEELKKERANALSPEQALQ